MHYEGNRCLNETLLQVKAAKQISKNTKCGYNKTNLFGYLSSC